MQTQNVNGISGGGLFFTAKSVAGKKTDTSFDQLIQMSQQAGAAEEKIHKPVETSKKDASKEVAQKPENTSETVAEDKAGVTDKSEKQTDMQKTEDAKEATDVEAAERAVGVVNQVTEQVKETLNLTDEQLAMLLEQLGLTQMDLLKPENLQNLVLLANNGQDAVVLLTDANLLAQVKKLTEQVEDILKEAQVTPEELASALEKVDFEEVVEEAETLLKEQMPETKQEEATTVETEKSTTIEFKVDTEVQTEQSHKDTKQDFTSQNDQFANQFVQNLQQAAEQLGEVTGQTDVVQVIREIADQILEKVKVTVNADTTSLEITLTPEELGKVNLTVTEQDGMLKAHFVTENELAKEAIESNLIQFKEMLNEQGLKVDSIEVMVGGFTFDKNSEAGQDTQEEKKNGNRHFMNDDELVQKEETDQLARHFMEGGESTVNYMA